jgi:hypothetical protein
VFRWINGCDPRQYGLDFCLWTRSVVADLIERKFAVRLGVSHPYGQSMKIGTALVSISMPATRSDVRSASEGIRR